MKSSKSNRREFLKLLTYSTLGVATTPMLASCATLFSTKMKNNGFKKAIVIGSGYGGAVAALRLTQKNIPTLLIEMGQEWKLTPKHDTFCKMITADKRSSWRSSTPHAPITIPFFIKKYAGVLDKEKHPNMDVFLGRGLGGGSLVNGGIAITPDKNYFEKILPSVNSEEMFDKYFPLANKALRVNTIEADFFEETPYYQFSRIAREDAKKAGYQTKFFPNVYDFEYMKKEAKGEVYKSALNGEVIYGNNAGKWTLDRTYIAQAQETKNLEIRTLCQVTNIEQLENGHYKILITKLNTKGEPIAQETYTCQYLFLGAGSMGTSKLLMKSKHEGGLSKLNEKVGQEWGSNGNIMTGRNFVNATGRKQSTIPVLGIDGWNDPENPIFAEIAPLPMNLETWTTLYLAITQNPERGYFAYNEITKEVQLIWNKNQNDPAKQAAKKFIDRMNKANGGIRSHLLFNNGYGDDFCYHPLGGCVLGKATDNYGRIENYKNLYAIDGSLIPGSVGVNPFVTITALAERNMDYILKEDFLNE
ncbi:GMC oxidoreductase [Bernardetia sp. MNP-M8]|uniref:GMC oxidoreductase n=1 Tax=Bernardetia sp. MNP-M8 TaxID=3127470 RepID=UPI0030D51184